MHSKLAAHQSEEGIVLNEIMKDELASEEPQSSV